MQVLSQYRDATRQPADCAIDTDRAGRLRSRQVGERPGAVDRASGVTGAASSCGVLAPRPVATRNSMITKENRPLRTLFFRDHGLVTGTWCPGDCGACGAARHCQEVVCRFDHHAAGWGNGANP